MSKKKKVLVAMSGGIDSSVAAILLKEQGYELTGVTFKTFDNISENCITEKPDYCPTDSVMEAKRIAEQLGFEHHILDAKTKFRDIIIKNFIGEYLECRTPNPCVICNSVIKWGLLLKMADNLDCDYLATGHYSRIGFENGRYYIQKGKDRTKDQSYFLWKIPQKLLSKTIFCLGDLTKNEVKKIAEEHGFTKLSQKKESEEICFIPDNDYRNFLIKEVPDIKDLNSPGDFVNTKGKILGKHKGLFNYTIGQRKGLGIAVGEAAYVVALKKNKNQVVLGNKDDLKGKSMYVNDINMMKYDDIYDGMQVDCKIRYRNEGAAAKLFHNGNRIRVDFKEYVDSITPGQSAVFYENEDLIGGGIIN